MTKQLNGYELSRTWFDWSFENPEKITPNHSALYFFCIEHCNRLGWKQKFGLPTTMAKEAIGIKSYNTYIKTLNNLIEWGFVLLIEKSTNQYSANIIALSNINKAPNKALDKALIKHGSKQRESISSIDKQVNKEPIKQLTIEERKLKFTLTLEKFLPEFGKEILLDFHGYWSESNTNGKKMKFEMQKTWDINLRLKKWKSNDKKFNTNNSPNGIKRTFNEQAESLINNPAWGKKPKMGG